jgi:tetratricopeptide (TPR) repeat protein
MASGGELNWVGTFPDPRQIWGKTIQVNNTYVAATYSQAYRIIFNANNILANIGIVAAADKAKVTAEAKFQRALAYFELIKYFGEKPYFAGSPTSLKGVPLITAPGPTAPQDAFYQLPRASVEAVYQQIIADITAAETDLPAKNGFYANKASASLALARVYLQQDKFAEARDAANRCITTATANSFSLVSSYENAFNNSTNTTEDLFAIQVTDQAGTNSCFTFFSTDTYGARDGDIEVTGTHYSKYSAGDLRRNLFFFEYGEWRCGKWRDVYKNVKVMRLAEAYLTRAECNRRLGTVIGATPDADLNVTRSRAGLTPAIVGATLQQILDERELELAFEGQGLWDAKRLRLTVDGKPWNDNKMTFPIPLRERNVNPGLDQNPGY